MVSRVAIGIEKNADWLQDLYLNELVMKLNYFIINGFLLSMGSSGYIQIVYSITFSM